MQVFTERRLQADFHFRLNVNVTVTVVSYMNSTSRETILPNFLQQWIDLNIFRSMTPESRSKAALFETNSQILFFLVFFYAFLKHKRDMRLSYLLVVFIFLQIHLDLPSRQKAYLKIKFFHKIQFFTVEFIHTCDDLFSFRFNYLCKFHLIPKLKLINNKSFLRVLLLLSGDISLNPGPVYNNQSFHSNEWNVFRSKEIDLIHLNVNSLLAKIDEIRYIAERTKAAVIGITESMLDESIFQSEIQIDNYDLRRCDRNRNGGGVACYIRSDISHVQKDFFPNVIENIFFEILLLKTSPITVEIMCRPPCQTNFLEILNMTFETVDVNKKEIYILGDFNINICHNNRYIALDDNTISSKFLSHDIKNYHQFCTMHGLKQQIH